MDFYAFLEESDEDDTKEKNIIKKQRWSISLCKLFNWSYLPMENLRKAK